MTKRFENRRLGRTGFPLVAAVLFVGLLIGIVQWTARGGTTNGVDGLTTSAEAAGPRSTMVETHSLNDSPVPPGAMPATRSSAPLDSGATLGIRLPGKGRLEGAVLELPDLTPAGAGLAVELSAVPPAASEFTAFALRLGGFSNGYARRTLPVAAVETDFEGRFAFEGVRSGTYFLRAGGSAHVPTPPSFVRVFSAGSGGPVEVYVRPSGQLTGIVFDPDGTPARGGTVAAFRGASSAIEAARRGDSTYSLAEIGADGRFALPSLPPGSGYDMTAWGPNFTLSHLLDVDVRAGQTTDVEIQTRRSGTMRGRVLGLTSEGVAEPLAGALVGVVPRGLRDLTFAEEVLRRTAGATGADGRFVLDDVPPGEVDVLAMGAEHLPGHLPGVAVGPLVESDAGDLILERGLRASGRLVDAAGKGIAGAEVRWDLGDFGRPQFDFSFAPVLYQAVERFDYPLTDADGRFEAGPINSERDPVFLDVQRVGFPWKRFAFDKSELAVELVLTLDSGGAVEGIVMNAETGAPVQAFTIDAPGRAESSEGEPGAWNPFSGGVAFDDGSGRFLLDGLRAGGNELVFRAQGLLPSRLDVDIAAGQTTRGKIVVMEPGATLRGRVVDSEGEPVLGARVLAINGRKFAQGERPRVRSSLLPLQGEWNNFLRVAPLDIAHGVGLLGTSGAITDREGTFELSAVQPGPVELVGLDVEHPPTRGPKLDVSAGEVVDGLLLELLEGSAIEGEVLDRFGDPVAYATVFAAAPPGAQPAGAGALYQATSNADGEYRIAPIPQGSYFVGVTRLDETLSPVSLFGRVSFDLVNVPRETTVAYDLLDRTASGVRVHGRVLDDGEPAAAGSLFAVDLASESVLGVDFKVAAVGRDGGFEFPGLAPGEYMFTYQTDGVRLRVEADVPDEREFELDIELPSGGVVGEVVAASDGAPVEEAWVVLNREIERNPGLLGRMFANDLNGAFSRTDEGGRFRIRDVSPGSYKLTVSPGRSSGLAASSPLSIEVGPDELIEGLKIELAAESRLSGTVFGPDGTPLGTTSVQVNDIASGRMAAADVTNSEGRYEMRGVSPGTYRIFAEGPGGMESEAQEVTIEDAGSSESIDLELRVGAEVRVCALSSTGAPAVGAIAMLERLDRKARIAGTDLDAALEGRGIANADGCLELGTLAPGRYRIEVARAGERGVLDNVVIEPNGGRLDLSVDLAADG